ncbi:MAG: hypothetical protein K0U16_07805 [Gammaproteobacteria bacterium]|nr:hypothetical protein [Gammaproteobacteria bacterium]
MTFPFAEGQEVFLYDKVWSVLGIDETGLLIHSAKDVLFVEPEQWEALAEADREARARPSPPSSGIWVIQHTLPNGDQLWWRPNSCGYTSELVAAGCYSAEEAARIDSGRPSDRAMTLESVVEQLESGTVGAAFGIGAAHGR